MSGSGRPRVAPEPRTVPRATYRVQLHDGFTLDDAASLAGYLSDLGITHLYCSPYLQAAAGSTHGYDVVDHLKVSETLGGADARTRMVDALASQGLGHILDVVPNHMATNDRRNEWWWDVLRTGRSSPYARFFDIDWWPSDDRLRGVVLVPILGDHYGRVLEAGELELGTEDDEIVVRYYDHRFPLTPGSLAEVFGDVSADAAIERANADSDLLDRALGLQHYRLAHWRVAGRLLNYRRFFAINDLAALRIEDPEVFERVHELVFAWVQDGTLHGLRIDHIDGLREPQTYLERVRERASSTYIVVEKILEPDEEMPGVWPVEGTTGYDFLNLVQGLFVDPSAEKPLTDLYEGMVGGGIDLAEERRAKKLMLLDTELATDLGRLTDLLVRICERHRRHRDHTRVDLRTALAETIAAFPVYRTYFDSAKRRGSERDRAYVTEAVQRAAQRRPDLDPELFTFLGDVLRIDVSGELEHELALRFQQTSGPVMAKGVEDTLFYTYNRFVALNEVGGDPSVFGISPTDFHARMRSMKELWPRTMLATSTHDTKRSEDVRARLCLLSEIPDRWVEAVERWSAGNERYKRDGWPDANAEYLLYQTLVGVWDPSAYEDGTLALRVAGYMHKATAEAKEHTSWIDPDARYDDSLRAFVTSVLDDAGFVDDLGEFAARLVGPGRVNSLAQTLIKLTAPGMPDIYQGQELWDLSLVDPDNRRPVDYETRRALAAETGTWGEARARDDAGATKLFVTRRALQVRHEHAAAFDGAYDPLLATGSKADHIVAFSRGDRVVTVVPRLVMGIADGWSDTSIELPDGVWANVLTRRTGLEGRLQVGHLLDDCPVALLVSD